MEEIIYICRTMTKAVHKVLLALLWPIQHLPLKFHYFCGKGFSWLCRVVARYRVDVVTVNLSRSFPELKYGAVKQLAKDFYNRLGEVFAETLWLGSCQNNPQRFFQKIQVDTEGVEGLAEDFRQGSVMVLNGHFGNWELIGAYLQAVLDTPGSGMIEKDVAVVYRGLHSAFSEEFFRRNRTAVQTPAFDGYVESRVVMRYVVQHKDMHKVYVFPTDQSPYGTAIARATLTFLGQPTQVMLGGASLAEKLSMPVWYMAADRVSRGHYKLSFRKICNPSDDLAPEAVMEQFYQRLEADIRRNPANYLWSHKRWK